ncbi:hypothetical protein RJ639_035923 [Escallonia herrerae]|uniref:Uncharacterized protein n=1 Tax=Escallonia herrerae TaxID=1293975 RepID=A0AA88WWE2_9ASTE|nr:hypothetical protein RJ639_035923 [Escallonia herrerae]
MANPRRNSNSSNLQLPISDNSSCQFQGQNLTTLSSLKLFLKKPHAFPSLLSVFLFLAWVSLRLQHSPNLSSFSPPLHRKWKLTATDEEQDRKANLVRFPSYDHPSPIVKDKRGWLLDPVSIARDAAISGGALSCASVHVGEIRPGGMRGNHRHYTCNETFLIWGAKTKFRLENNAIGVGYAEVTIGADEVAVAASPSGTTRALLNMDPVRTTFFLGCQDSVIDYNSSTSDFNIWNDL